MPNFVNENNLNKIPDITISGNAIQDLRRAVLTKVIFRPQIQKALQKVNFRFHRSNSFLNLLQEYNVAEGRTHVIFWGLKGSESRATISMSPSRCSSLQMPPNPQNMNIHREREFRSTIQQTDISCRFISGIGSPVNPLDTDEQRLVRARIVDSLTFSSPPSSVIQTNGRSVSILSSVCALLLTKQGSPGKEISSANGSQHSYNICRICFGGESAERLVRPCSCRGTIAAVHRACLERWLLQASTSYCELCRHHYVVTRTHKWTFVRSVWEWLSSGRGRALAADAWRAAALGAASVLGTARALHAADAVLQAGARRGGGASLAANLFSSVLIGIIGALNGLLTTWMLLKIQEHQMSWRAWREGTIHVHVSLEEPTPTASNDSFATVVGDPPEPTTDRSTNIADPFMVSLPYNLPD